MSAEYTFRHSCAGPLTAAFAVTVFETVDSVLGASCEAEITGGITIDRGPSSVRFDSPSALCETVPPLEPLSGFRLARFPARPGAFPPEPSVTVSMDAGDTSFSVIVSASNLTAAQNLAMALKSAMDEKEENPIQNEKHSGKPHHGQFWDDFKKFFHKTAKILSVIGSVLGAVAALFGIIEFLMNHVF